jgi:hypothetical protein
MRISLALAHPVDEHPEIDRTQAVVRIPATRATVRSSIRRVCGLLRLDDIDAAGADVMSGARRGPILFR